MRDDFRGYINAAFPCDERPLDAELFYSFMPLSEEFMSFIANDPVARTWITGRGIEEWQRQLVACSGGRPASQTRVFTHPGGYLVIGLARRLDASTG